MWPIRDHPFVIKNRIGHGFTRKQRIGKGGEKQVEGCRRMVFRAG